MQGIRSSQWTVIWDTSIKSVAISGKIDKKVRTICLSIEELLSDINTMNERKDIKDLVIISTDVVNMFSNHSIDPIANIIGQEYLKSNLEYLSITKKYDYILQYSYAQM